MPRLPDTVISTGPRAERDRALELKSSGTEGSEWEATDGHRVVGLRGGATGGLRSQRRQDHRGGPLEKPVWAEEDTDNPSGPPQASPGLQGRGPWDRAGFGSHKETQQLFRVVRE